MSNSTRLKMAKLYVDQGNSDKALKIYCDLLTIPSAYRKPLEAEKKEVEDYINSKSKPKPKEA